MIFTTYHRPREAGLAELIGTALLVFLGCGVLVGIPLWDFQIFYSKFETSNILSWHMDIYVKFLVGV